MVGGRWSVVGGRWWVVGGRWWVVGGRYYSIKNHGIFLSEKRALFLMDTWFCLLLIRIGVLGVGGWEDWGRGKI